MKKRDLPVCPIDLRNAKKGDRYQTRGGQVRIFTHAQPDAPRLDMRYCFCREDGSGFTGRTREGFLWASREPKEADIVKKLRKSPAPAKREVKEALAWKRWAIVTTDGRAVCTYHNRQTARNSLRHFDGKVIRVEIREVRK